MTRLTANQMDVLWQLPGPNEDMVQPMDIGAWNSSHHSGTLRQLAIMGLVVRQDRYGLRPPHTPEEVKSGIRYRDGKRYRLRGPYRYKATAEGKARWRAQREEG